MLGVRSGMIENYAEHQREGARAAGSGGEDER